MRTKERKKKTISIYNCSFIGHDLSFKKIYHRFCWSQFSTCVRGPKQINS